MRHRRPAVRRVLTLCSLAALVPTLLQASATAQAGTHDPKRRALHRLHEELDLVFARTSPAGPSPSAPIAPAVTQNFRILGHERLLKDEVHADVFFYDHGRRFGKFAYIGSWGGRCAGVGVNVIDVSDPSNPRLVAIAGSRPGESHEDVVVRRIGGHDILGIGVQQCGRDGRSGLDLWDVTDPRHPEHIRFFKTPGGVHELDIAVRPGGRALALLALPFLEFGNTYLGQENGGELRIVDITKPSKPVELADWGVIADASIPIPSGTRPFRSTFQGLGNSAVILDHSVRAADDGMTAYASWWDVGVLKFDISNPSHPSLVGRTTFPIDADGSAHSMTPYDAGGQRYLLTNDEDGEATPVPTVTSSATGDTKYGGVEMWWAPTPLYSVGPLEGRVFDAGEGCAPRDYRHAGGRIVIADAIDPFYRGLIEGWPRPPCKVGEQAILAAQADAIAFLPSLVSPDNTYPYFQGRFREVQRKTGGMPIVGISRIDHQVRAIRSALDAGERVTMRLEPGVADRGYLRVFRESSVRDLDGDGVLEYRQVGAFNDLANVIGEIEPPAGTWEIHNTEVNGSRAYSSWYTNGIVALDMSNPANPSMVGQFIPPATRRFEGIFGAPFPLVWGVAIDPETGIVYASDMRSGLWIVQPTGPAAAP